MTDVGGYITAEISWTQNIEDCEIDSDAKILKETTELPSGRNASIINVNSNFEHY